MHKTISLNLGGTVFHAEEPAFEKLSQYLAAIRRNFKNEEGGEEIVQDIEARLAELFLERLNQSGVQALTESTVQDVIREMGNPQDFSDTETEENAAESASGNFSAPRPTKRLFRDPDDRILGGVCGGVGAYLGVDPLWIRLIFAVLFFGFGTGFLVYFLLWIIVPEAKTTTDKLQMRGDPVNLDSINRFIREEAATIQEKTGQGAVRNSVNKGADIMLRIFQALVKGALYGLAAASVAVSLAIIIGLSIGMFSLVFTAGIHENPIRLLISENQLYFSAASIFLLFGIPFFWLLYKGFAFLFRVPGPGTRTGYTLLLLWILGFVLGAYATTDIVTAYSAKAVLRKQETVADSTRRRFIVKAMPPASRKHRVSFFDSGWTFHSESTSASIQADEVSLRLEKSTSGQFEIWQVLSSRGASESEANLLAASARLPIQQQDSFLIIPSGITLPDNKWRAQSVEIILRVPEGYQVDFDPSVRRLWERAEDNPIAWGDRYARQSCVSAPEGIRCTEIPGAPGTFSGDSRAIQMDGFTEVEADEDARVTVRIGKSWKVQVYGEDRDDVQIEKQGNRLVIEQMEFWDDDTRVVIEMPALERIRLMGAAEAEVLDFNGGNLDGRLSGASHLVFRGKADALTL